VLLVKEAAGTISHLPFNMWTHVPVILNLIFHAFDLDIYVRIQSQYLHDTKGSSY